MVMMIDIYRSGCRIPALGCELIAICKKIDSGENLFYYGELAWQNLPGFVLLKFGLSNLCGCFHDDVALSNKIDGAFKPS